MGTVLVFVCLLSYVSSMDLHKGKSDVKRSTLEEYDPEIKESIDKVVLQHAQGLLQAVLEEPDEAERLPGGKIFCLENVRIKYATCRIACESMQGMERLQCNAIMFHRFLINCYGDDLDCYPGDTDTTTTVTSRPATTTPDPTTLAPQTGNCGISLDGINSRLIGGENVTPNNKYPWQVGLSIKKIEIGCTSCSHDYVCSGSLITKKHILTAASCFNDVQTYYIGFGSANEKKPTFTRSQKRYVPHPKFNRVTYDYNIAIIELDETIDFDKKDVRPICLPGSSNNLKVTATISGWGDVVGPGDCKTPTRPDHRCRPCTTTTGSCPCEVGKELLSGATSCSDCKPSTKCPCEKNFNCQAKPTVASFGTLQETQVLLDKCPDRSRYTNNMICSEVGTAPRDACKGDAGGPVIVDINGRYEQVGIISFGSNDCGIQGASGVYVNVGKFLDWINKEVAPERTFR